MKYIMPLVIAAMVSTSPLYGATSSGSASYKNETLATVTHNGSIKLEDVMVENLMFSGSADIEKVQLTTCDIRGSAEVEKSLIIGATQFYGSLKAKKSKFKGTLIAHGSVKIKECSFDKSVEIHGTLKAEKAGFKGEMILYSTDVKFDEVGTKNITIEVKKSEAHTPKISLKETTIAGNVTFKEKPGVVYLDEKSTIIGKVVNGQVKQG